MFSKSKKSGDEPSSLNSHSLMIFRMAIGLVMIHFASGQVWAGSNPGFWSELDQHSLRGDAPSFPDGEPQITQGEGSLIVINGSTSANDPRDAYCIKISDPNTFVITSDEAVNGFAIADFDTRLFLFDRKGEPVLYNDDTPPSGTPFGSTLRATADDGSGFALTQPGEYVLVVGGFSDDPLDNVANKVFNSIGNTAINSANTSASKFAAWENSNPETGNYTLTLQGVEHCQTDLDIVGVSINADNSLICSTDQAGDFLNCNPESNASIKSRVATGFLNQDSHMDAVFSTFGDGPPTICLGNGAGGYSHCSTHNVGNTYISAMVVADFNHDGINDVFFASGLDTYPHVICPGNGMGGLNQCAYMFIQGLGYTKDIESGFMNGDRHRDVVFTQDNGTVWMCRGDGTIGFAPQNCILGLETDVNDLTLADIDGDGNEDVVFARTNDSFNRYCKNMGTDTGTFAQCQNIGTDQHSSNQVAHGDLDNDGDIDLVFTNANLFQHNAVNRVCLNQSGSFTCSDISGQLGAYYDIEIGLLNGDNIPDLAMSQSTISETLIRTCIGDGSGGFSNCSGVAKMVYDFSLVEFGQYDGIFKDSYERYFNSP